MRHEPAQTPRPTRLAALMSARRQDWQTPPELFRAVHARFGFTLDAAASAANALLPRFYTRADDGLRQPWAPHVVWCNPPYGREVGLWMRKAALERTAAVLLVPARTDTAWWHDWVLGRASEVTFLRGRVRFVGATAGAPFPSALVVFAAHRLGLKVRTARLDGSGGFWR